jgi:SAM-dependent methyltransferase
MLDTRTEAARVANSWFHTNHGSTVYDTFQAEYLATAQQVFLEVALQKLGRTPHRILDVGCGGGNGLAYLAERLPDAELHGIDPEAAMLERAQTHIGERCYLQQANLLNYNAEGCTFDLIVSHSTFRFWAEPAASLSRMRTLLAPKSLGYLLDLHRDIDEAVRSELISRMQSDDLRMFLTSQLDSSYQIDEVRAILEEAGLSPYALQVGGFAGYEPRSREAFEMLQQNERLAEIIFSLHQSGFQSDRGHESVFYLTITN